MESNLLPRGVPTLSYVRVLDPEGGVSADIALDGDFVTVMEPGQPTTRHEVAHVFERGISDQQFCECTIGQDAGASMNASLNPIAACVEDATTAVVFLVGSKFAKKWQFLKRIFLPFASNELFECIRDKDNQGAEVYEFELTLSAFEIQDEIITDLLRPSSRGLTISVSPENGLSVQGIHKERVSDELSLRQALIDACDNRACHTLPPGGSIDTSSAIWEITLAQKEGDEDVVLYNKSRLIFVDIPAVNPLCPGDTQSQIFDSPALHKSLYTFSDCAKKLASPTQSTLAPFRSSKLTHYFSELLGGNAVVLALGILHPGEAMVTRKVLEVLNNLTNARHYPISGKETNELITGLTMKYRSMILSMEDEVNARTREQAANTAKSKISAAEDSKTDMEEERKFKQQIESKLAEAQTELAQLKIDRDLARQDAVQMYEMMELLKAKYGTLIGDNTKQNEELMKSEAEKLEVARALVDMKLELSNVLETAERDKFELSTQVLSLKNRILESEEREQISQIALSDAKAKLEDCQRLLEQEKEMGAVTRTQLSDLRTQLDAVEDRNLEISSELVTLLNARDALTMELEAAQKKYKELVNDSNSDKTDISALRSANKDYESKINDLERENEDLQRQLTEDRFELHRIHLDMEKSKLEFERSTNEYLKGKDVVAKKETQASHNEIQRLQYEKEQLIVSLRREERKRRDDGRQKQRVEEECKVAKDALREAVAENDRLRESYRAYLSGLIQMEGKPPITARTSRPTSTASPNQKRELRPQSGNVSATGASEDQTFEDLVRSYRENEKKLFGQMRATNESQEQTVTSWRQLYDYYRNAIDIIEDNCPHVMPAHIIEDENMRPIPPLPSSGRTSEGNNRDKDGMQRDVSVKTLERRVKYAEEALLQEQEGAANTIVKYKKRVEKAEQMAAQKEQENAFLKEQLANGGGKGDSDLKDMYARLQQQMTEMKRHGGTSVDLRRQLTGLKAQYNILEEENQEMRALLLRLNHKGAKAEYTPNESDDADLLHMLKEIEGRNASLTSRNASLQEELRAYKVYMRDTVSQYKRQIKTLQAHIASYNISSGRDKDLQLAVAPKDWDEGEAVFIPNLQSDHVSRHSGRGSDVGVVAKQSLRLPSNPKPTGLPDIGHG